MTIPTRKEGKEKEAGDSGFFTGPEQRNPRVGKKKEAISRLNF